MRILTGALAIALLTGVTNDSVSPKKGGRGRAIR